MNTTRSTLIFVLIFSVTLLLTLTFHKDKPQSRKQVYAKASKILSTLSDTELTHFLSNQVSSEEHSPGITTGTIFLGEIPLFVKQISLTDTEMLPKNKFSTANVFNLPLHYYRPGFAGFGAWRELYCNQQATKWVLTKEQKRFPLLYHFRILKKTTPPDPAADFLLHEDDEWEIVHFINEHKNASFDLVLFFEYIPETLTKWLDKKFAEQSPKKINATMRHVKEEFEKLTTFLHSKKVVHIDPHFENILVKNDTFFWADFGLATMDEFDLDSLEKYYCNKCLGFTKNSLQYHLFEYLLERYDFDLKTLTTSTKDGTQPPKSIVSFFLKNYKSAYTFLAELSKKRLNPQSLFPTDELFAQLVENYKPNTQSPSLFF